MRHRPSSLLQREIRQHSPFSSLEEEAFLNLERSWSLLLQAFSLRMKPYSLTPTQYNVLRILRGAHPAPLSCGEIGQRLVTPTPDVTRLLDRLERRALISRHRAPEGDRRVVLVGILPRGLETLSELDAPVLEWLRDLLGHLERKELRTLVQLLEEARGPLVGNTDAPIPV